MILFAYFSLEDYSSRLRRFLALGAFTGFYPICSCSFLKIQDWLVFAKPIVEIIKDSWDSLTYFQDL